MNFGVSLSAVHFDGLTVASLTDRVHKMRADEYELRFTTRHKPGILPVEMEHGLGLAIWGESVPWGKLPDGRFTWKVSIESGKWAQPGVSVVRIPCDRVYLNGVWQPAGGGGIAGVLVRPPESGTPRVYVVVEPADRYDMIMFKSDWSPVPWSEVNTHEDSSERT